MALGNYDRRTCSRSIHRGASGKEVRTHTLRVTKSCICHYVTVSHSPQRKIHYSDLGGISTRKDRIFALRKEYLLLRTKFLLSQNIIFYLKVGISAFTGTISALKD